MSILNELLTIGYVLYAVNYRIAGNFRALQFSRMWGFEVFRVLIFEDGR